ncbi:unnamed protein product [Brachionus calyciflorus]|uniref:Chitinase n=1 Tax=Brachionus calyciflorus TaxID=104777 RepID=A0A814P1I1_9BILA|nr:unnamed protein product [Brachionus calyciflorus]
MVWTIDFDDFKGTFCGQGQYPLMTILNEVLKDPECPNQTSKPTTKTQSTVTQTSTTTSTRPQIYTETFSTQPSQISTNYDSNEFCYGRNFISSPLGCKHFQVCIKGFLSPIATIKCPNDFWFDLTQDTCVKDKPSSCYGISTHSTSIITPKNTKQSYSYDPSVPKSSFTPTKKSSSLMTKTTTKSTSTKNTGSTILPSTYKQQDFNGKDFKCPEPSGLFPNFQNCRLFWHCSNNIAYKKQCPGNLVFDSNLKTCSWSSNLCQQKFQNIVIPKLDLSDNSYRIPNKIYNDIPLKSFSCPKPDGLFQNTNDCKTFWQCSNNIPVLKNCPGNLLFNEKAGSCDFKGTCKERAF